MRHQRLTILTSCAVMLVMTLWTPTTKAAYITGSGTSGRISKFTGSATIGNSVLFESASGYLGLGTTSPRGPLHISTSSPDPLFLQSLIPGVTLSMKDSWTTAVGGQAIARIADDLELRTMDTPRLIVAADGKVVITPTGWAIAPTHQLTVDADATGTWATDDGGAQLVLRGSTNAALRVAVGVDTGNTKGRIQAASGTTTAMDLLLQPAGGNVGIGCTTTTQKLQVAGTIYSTSGGFKFPDGTTQTTAATGGGGGSESGWTDTGTSVVLTTSTDKVGIGTATPSKALTVRGNILIEDSNGTAVMELGEGLDYAEGFDVTEGAAPAPGSVLVIDTENPGRLTTTTKAYDTRVAGIVAGAQGVSSAVRLGVGQFDCDVALAGRVYCNVDATETGIQPGDLLTTSSTAGYAMKATDAGLTHGAILGKAMQSLAKGQRGQILVLVTLQ